MAIFLKIVPRFDALNHDFVRWQPIHVINLTEREPSRSLMLIQRQTATLYVAPETMHLKKELRILIFHCLYQPLHDNPLTSAVLTFPRG